MGSIKKHESSLLFAGMIASIPSLFASAAARIAVSYGEILLESPPIHFEETDYYKSETGEPLYRKFFAFSDPFDPGKLAEVKHVTNRMEEALHGREGLLRPLNIDPGYLTLAKVVLASTKNHAHRMYLSRGIFAELTLSFKGGKFQSMPWTYPDYRRREYLDFFLQLREALYNLTVNRGAETESVRENEGRQ